MPTITKTSTYPLNPPKGDGHGKQLDTSPTDTNNDVKPRSKATDRLGHVARGVQSRVKGGEEALRASSSGARSVEQGDCHRVGDCQGNGEESWSRTALRPRSRRSSVVWCCIGCHEDEGFSRTSTASLPSAAAGQGKAHNASEDTSLMKTRRPEMAGCAHVALSATR
jgi:hypothetical protein